MFRGMGGVIAVLALVCVPSALAAPGDLDAGFGSGGAAFAGKGLLTAAAFDDQGRILTGGVVSPYSSGPVQVTRWTAAGVPDASFGVQGTASLPRAGTQVAATAVVAGPGGTVYVCGGGQGGAFVARLLDDGTPDPSFGSGGVVGLEAAKGGSAWGMVATPSGLVVAYAPYGTTAVRLARLDGAGALDTSFSAHGIAQAPFDPATLPPTGASGQQALVRRADGALLLGGVAGGKPAIAGFTDAGAPLSGFGAGGLAVLSGSSSYGVVSAITIADDGDLVVLAAGAVARLHADGTPDTTFGAGGRRALTLTAAGATQLAALAPQPGGGVLVAGAATMPVPTPMPVANLPPTGTLYVSGSTGPVPAPQVGVVLTRLTASGAVDCTYGSYGRTRILPDGFFAADAQTLALDGDGRALTAGTARGPDNNAVPLLTRTATGPGAEPELAAPSVVVGWVDGSGWAKQPTLTGWVDPRCGDVAWHFEYGPSTAYGRSTPATALPAAGGLAAVSVPLAGLGAGTYHYRLVADGPAGPVASEDATFTMTVASRGGPGRAPEATAGPTTKVAGRLRLLSARATVRSGRTVRFAVRCRDGSCRRTPVTLRAGHTTYGTGLASLSSGRKGYVRVTLTRAGRSAVRRHRTLRATATLAVTGGHTTKAAVTLRSPRR